MRDGIALDIDGLTTGYGKSQVLNGVSLNLHWGEVVSLIGPNGAGKSTLIKAAMGILRFRTGSIRISGEDVTGRSTPDLLRKGLGMVPEGGRVFAPLTVQENLDLGGLLLGSRRAVQERVQEMYEMFPRLAERRRQNAGTLSGGERQMLAIARCLMMKPRIIFLDEPSLGMAPMFVSMVMDTLRRRADEDNISVCMVEQNARAALRISDRTYAMNIGKIVHETDDPASLLEGTELLRFLEAH